MEYDLDQISICEENDLILYLHPIIFPIFFKTNKIATVFDLCYKFVALLISKHILKKVEKIRSDSPQKKSSNTLSTVKDRKKNHNHYRRPPSQML